MQPQVIRIFTLPVCLLPTISVPHMLLFRMPSALVSTASSSAPVSLPCATLPAEVPHTFVTPHAALVDRLGTLPAVYRRWGGVSAARRDKPWRRTLMNRPQSAGRQRRDWRRAAGGATGVSPHLPAYSGPPEPVTPGGRDDGEGERWHAILRSPSAVFDRTRGGANRSHDKPNNDAQIISLNSSVFIRCGE